MKLNELMDLDRRAKALGGIHEYRRDLYSVVAREEGRHVTGILGPRGAGKTILLQQLANASEDGFYLSADTLERDIDLFRLIRDLSEKYGFKVFFIDEIHYLDDGIGALKQIYDFLGVRVIFTGSVALRIHEAAHDPARRVRLYRLEYFSFREFLSVRHGERLPPLELDALLNGNVLPEHLRCEDRFEAYLGSGMIPFALEEPEPLPLLAATLETVVTRDIPRFLRLHTDELEVLRKLVAFVGRSAVDGINYSSLSENLGITKYKAEQYVAAFERAFLLQRLFPAGSNVIKEPKVLLMPPVRLLYRSLEEGRGGLREDFFAFAMRQAGLALHYLKGTRGQKTPDFLLRREGRNLVFEVGGKGKGRSQFKGVQTDRKYIFGEGLPLSEGKIPLHLAGLLAGT